MVYHPYFRGKQFELVAIREKAPLMAESNFVPIIEPVKEQLKVLQKTLDTIRVEQGSAVVITNPQIGEHAANPAVLGALLNTQYGDHHGIRPGLLLTAEMTPQHAVQFAAHYSHREVVLVHGTMSDGKALADAIVGIANISSHVFLDKKKLYQSHFETAPSRILIRDGFEWRPANRDYPAVEEFSDLHVTYQMEGMTGFGDFLMVGHRFVEGGGPAYAIAIHLTYIPTKTTRCISGISNRIVRALLQILPESLQRQLPN